ncbi:hypothetical protein [Pontibacter sp. G13]|uniref:hypothetical protein n=1 Tax=Pontibacter sp. G13 TaxID=3074898 RepID=UPI00288A9ADA|nr:hypothetical protein [Pontibacter sp. G13]WNJ17037.1 hypothetical protein RJD25_19455 [Pontibacter sp. G13]
MTECSSEKEVTSMSNTPNPQQVNELIAKNRIEEVFGILLSVYRNDPDFGKLLNYSANFYQVQGDHENGTITQQAFNLELNTIRKNILNFVQRKQAEGIAKPLCTKEYRQVFALSLARIKVVNRLLEIENPVYPNGYTISELCDLETELSRKSVVHCLDELKSIQLLKRHKINGSVKWSLTDSGVLFFQQ